MLNHSVRLFIVDPFHTHGVNRQITTDGSFSYAVILAVDSQSIYVAIRSLCYDYLSKYLARRKSTNRTHLLVIIMQTQIDCEW